MNIRIAVDDLKSISKVKKKVKGAEIIYVFDDNVKFETLIRSRVHCIHRDCVQYVDINTSQYEIECLKKCSVDDDLRLPDKINYKIGVIVPNCNYGNLLKKCLSSILNQTYQNFEIIFVDDCSTDNSVEIARELIGDKGKVIQLKQKRLNGGARNEAYLHLSEDVDYVYYVDSDDWLYDNNVFTKINNKLQSHPDVLFVTLARYKNKNTEVCIVPKYIDKYEAIKGWSGSCGKVIKKSLAVRQDCLYNEGTLKEDRNQHCRICIHMNSFELLKEPVYVWNQENRKSVTSIREKIVWGTSTIRHYADTLQLYLTEKGKDDKIDKFLEERVNKTRKEMESGGDRQW